MITVYLYGILKEKFGESFSFDVETPAMAMSGLLHQLQGFRQIISDGNWHVYRGERKPETSLDENELGLLFGSKNEMHLEPALIGRGGKGGKIAKIVIGVALVAAGIYFGGAAGTIGISGLGVTAFSVGSVGITYGAIAAIGLATALSGVAGLLTPSLKVDSYTGRPEADQRQSFLFNGAINTNAQGGPIPLIFGRMRVGSVVASAGVAAERI
ncbi:MAG: tail assembly protein [Caulobacteraceae bacterium]|nr:tail assembly protein [Caulobacteraceae bacterium]